MNEKGHCPTCGAKIPANAVAGQCPKCLLEMGFARADQSQPKTEATPNGSSSPGFEPPPIDDLADRFPQLEILELLGQGGMGAVYKARQRNLDRLVAVKILPPEVGADPAFAERFVREAHALAKLSHPHIVAVHDSGKSGEFCYLIMEYVDGVNLRQAMQADQLGPDEALAIVPQICDALQYAHDQGIVHRDIKPENILVTGQGHVKIADFGLARLLTHSPAERTLTATHQVMGTVHYMAPEQMQGSHLADHRADIYSLGVVFYEMLTGQLPLGRFEPPSKKVQIDVRLDEVVLRSLESEPGRRYQCAGEVRSDVDSIVESKREFLTPPQPTNTMKSQRDSAVGFLPRYSRKAILGAAWAPFFFLFVVSLFVSSSKSSVRSVEIGPSSGRQSATEITEEDLIFGQKTATRIPSFDDDDTDAVQVRHFGSGPKWWQWVLICTLLPLGIMAPIGTTILGTVSISEIRHSHGHLLGLPLAVADALLFPLLLLDCLIFVVLALLTGVLLVLVAKILGGSGVVSVFALGIAALLALPVCILVDLLLVRSVWRKAKSSPK